MTKYIEFPLEGGGTILVEAPTEEIKGKSGFVQAAASPADLVAQAGQSLDAAFENVKKSANLLVDKLSTLSTPPDEMDIKFYLKASGEVGNIAIGRVGAEANYEVTLKWKKDGGEKKDK